jgi:NADPH:quinone reductase-like Zn-dependent oxidoreductase
VPGGFDIVLDGIAEDGGRRSLAALKPSGLLCVFGYTAGAQANRRWLILLVWATRLHLLGRLAGGKRVRIYSINHMRTQHPAWFREDLTRLFELSAAGTPPAAHRQKDLLR